MRLAKLYKKILLAPFCYLKYLHRFDKNKKEGIGMDVCSLRSALFFLSWYIQRHHPPKRDPFSSIWLHSILGLHCCYYSSYLPPDPPMNQLQLFSIPLISPFRNYLYQEPKRVTWFWKWLVINIMMRISHYRILYRCLSIWIEDLAHLEVSKIIYTVFSETWSFYYWRDVGCWMRASVVVKLFLYLIVWRRVFFLCFT